MLRLGHHPILPEDLKVGEFVLWHGPRRKNKLQFQWHGPYRVKEKVNDVKYIAEDPLDGATRNVSVQQIVAVLGEFDGLWAHFRAGKPPRSPASCTQQRAATPLQGLRAWRAVAA